MPASTRPTAPRWLEPITISDAPSLVAVVWMAFAGDSSAIARGETHREVGVPSRARRIDVSASAQRVRRYSTLLARARLSS